MSEFNPLGRFPSLRQLESPPARPADSKATRTGPVAPGKGSLRDSPGTDGSGRDLGSRQVRQGGAGGAAGATVAALGLPALDPRDGESLNVLVMALAAGAKSGKLTAQKIERLVQQALAAQVHPQRAAKHLPPVALDAEMMAHLVRRVGRNARQFFNTGEPRLGDFHNYQAVMDWAAAGVLRSGSLMDYGMLRQAVLEGLPPGTGPFGPLQRGWLDTGIRTLLSAMDGAAREKDEVRDDVRDLLALAGADAHPGWLETAMIALTEGDRAPAGQPAAEPAARASPRPAADTKHTPVTDEAIARQTALDRADAVRALEGLAKPLRRQEELVRAVLAWNPQATPQQLFGAMRGLGRGVLMAGLVGDEDLGAMMHVLVQRTLQRGVHSPDQLPSMIAGLGEGLRDAHPKKGKALGGHLTERLEDAVIRAGGKQLGPFAREIAHVSLRPGFAARQGYLAPPLQPAPPDRDGKQ